MCARRRFQKGPLYKSWREIDIRIFSGAACFAEVFRFESIK